MSGPLYNEASTPTSSIGSSLFRSQTLKEATRKMFSRMRTVSVESPEISILRGGSDKQGLSFEERHLQHSNSEDLHVNRQRNPFERKASIFKRKKQPQIIITPAREEDEDKSDKSEISEIKKSQEDLPEVKSVQSIQEVPPPKLDRKGTLQGIFRKKTTKNPMLLTVEKIRHRQSLTRQSTLKGSKIESGRLLSIVAKQALFGKHPDSTKAFLTALKKVNPKALDRARIDHLMKRKKKFQWYLRKLRKMSNSILEPWRPDSKLVMLWKIFILLLIICQSFVSTYIIAFLPDVERDFTHSVVYMDLIFDIFYIFDIVANFRIAFYRHGELCAEPSEIASNYLKTYFILDVLSEASIIGRFITDPKWRVLMLIDLLRIFRLPYLMGKIEDFFQFSRQISSLFHLGKLIVAIIMFAHWCGCILYSVARSETGPVNWITVAGIDENSISDIYVACLYWAIATMATIGYGDIHPTTYRERVVSVIIMIASSVIFGYILSSIGALLIEINAFNSESREKMRLLTKYMKEKGLSKEIQSKIRKYLEFYMDKENTMKTEGDNILQLLSFNLKEEVIKEVNAKILGDTYMFESNFRKKFLYIISKDLIEKALTPDELVYSHNDTSDHSIYFITTGKIEIFYEKCAVNVQKLGRGDNFGFLSFFSGRARAASVKSLEFTTVFQLTREKFIERLEEFPSEKETYCMIKDSITLYNNYQYLNLKCYSCGSKSHITLECPKFHCTWDRKKIISKYREQEIEFRKEFIRMPRKRFHALTIIEELNEAVSQIQVVQQNELYVEDEQEEHVQIYSEGEEILDRNIYDPQPITYTVEPVQTKAISIPRNKLTSLQSFQLVQQQQQERRRRTANEIGDVHSFAISNYDAYYHSLNLDKVKNFEVYYPNNNISKLLVGMEKVRLEKIVHMRLGVNAKHISHLLVKSFRMNERRKTKEAAAINAERADSIVSVESSLASPHRRDTLTQQRRETLTGRRDTISGRRETLTGKIISSINPVDITFYNSYQKSSADFANTNRSHGENSDHEKQRLSYPHPDHHNPRRSIGNMSSSNPSPISAHYHFNFDMPQSGLLHQTKGRKIIENGSGDDIPQEKMSFIRHHRRRSSKRSRQGTEDNQYLDGTDEHSDSASDSDSRTQSVLNTRLKVGGSQFRSEVFSNKDGSVYTYTEKPGSPSHFLKEKNARHPRGSKQFDNSYELTIQSRKESSEGLHISSRPRLSSQIRGSLLGVGTGTANFFEESNPPSGIFDFSKQMQKISQKLEENYRPSASRSKERRRTRKKTINSNNIMSIMLSEQNEKENNKLRKGRSFSQDMGREIGSVIERFGIDKVFAKNKKKR